MKTKNVLLIAGITLTVAGLAAYLLGTENGRKVVDKAKKKGEDLTGKAEDLVDEVIARANQFKAKMSTCKTAGEEV